MKSEIKYDVNQVVGRLASKIANLEMQLAYSQALSEAYRKEVEKLKSEQKEKAE